MIKIYPAGVMDTFIPFELLFKGILYILLCWTENEAVDVSNS
jgi:hypothetical protein